MRGDQRYYSTLLQRYLRNELPASEAAQLFDWINEEPAAFEKIIGDADVRMHLVERSATIHVGDEASVRMKNRLLEAVGHSGSVPASRVALQPSPGLWLINRWAKYAAAVIMVLTGISLYYIFFKADEHKSELVKTTVVAPADIAPGYNRAVLTLSDGKKIELGSAASETINDGILSIKNDNGQLNYASQPIPSLSSEAERRATGGVAPFNTMTTPKGGQYQLTLADGTKVWLNAASSITYPTVFLNKTREVTISGEAYFEVAKNKQKPFIVKTVSDEITVLGTSFNVNAYADERYVKTSLLEGAVKIKNTNIKPGQAYQDGKIITTNIAQDIAWKNGFFDFNNLGIQEGLRQLSRWYDIEIIYDGKLPEGKFGGKINRSVSLKSAIELLDGLGIKLKLEGRELHVKAL